MAQDQRGLSPVEHYATTDVHYLSHHVHGPSAAAVSFGLSERVHVTFWARIFLPSIHFLDAEGRSFGFQGTPTVRWSTRPCRRAVVTSSFPLSESVHKVASLRVREHFYIFTFREFKTKCSRIPQGPKGYRSKIHWQRFPFWKFSRQPQHKSCKICRKVLWIPRPLAAGRVCDIHATNLNDY